MSGEELSDPLIGSKLGPCRIEVRLAAGGMGVVYRARHSVLNEDVAVKVLAPQLSQDQEYVTRFFREAGAAGAIDHPNVVRVIDVGRSEDRYYLIMEYVQGDTLDRIIDQERRLSLERATKYLRDIAAGLAAAHRSGTIHRDIKPGNVIISPDGVCHLTDFGLARQTNPNTRKGLTIEGTFLGTPEYSSPEQVEGKKLDHRTDLYSLGVTYYHMISGTLPFLGDSAMEIAIKRTKEEPRPLESAFPGADPRACAIVRKLLHVEPVQRYQSATDLIRDLDAILQGPVKGAAARVSETTRKVDNVLQVARARRRSRMIAHWALMILAVLLAYGSGALAARGSRLMETWAAEDAGRGLRFGLLGGGLLLALGSQFIYRREFTAWGRRGAVLLLDGCMLFGAFLAGLWIERAPGLSGAGRALLDHGLEQVNRFALAVVAFGAAAQLSFEREPGTHRVWISRVLLLAAYMLSYAFGVGRMAPGAPFPHMLMSPEISIPLATIGVFAGIFGLIFLTGYDYESGMRWTGALLAGAACLCLGIFPLLVGQPARTDSWLALLREPFADFGAAARRSGTLFAAVILLGAVERAVSFAGMKRQEKSYRRRF